MDRRKQGGNVSQVVGNLPAIIENDEGLYEGDLAYYYYIVDARAKNLWHPYHNFRHMFHVMFACYLACQFYRDVLSRREIRNLLIAALFHDFDHSGMMGHDDLNIERALRGLKAHILPKDLPFFDAIAALMRGTEFPYRVPVEQLDLCGKILRDADMSQAFSVAWIQQVIYGLAAEWKMRPIDVLKQQEPFLRKVSFLTEWGRRQFSACEIEAKIREAQRLIELYERGEAEAAQKG